MRQLIVILFSLFWFFLNSFSEENVEPKNNLILRAMPLSMLDFNLRFGLEYISSKKNGYSVDFGIGNIYIEKGD